ncbi:MAG TPA: nucleotide exchange factor GrpE, partial [Chlamydiales bacterium]|nr:nucleotide exchange factor GrpE [Chlamydiales bacterium]
ETVETNNFAEGTILKEFSKGYKSAVRTIRAARVQVAKKCEADIEDEEKIYQEENKI